MKNFKIKIKCKILLLFYIVNFSSAQQFFFSTHRPKKENLQYDCQSAKDYHLTKVSDYKEYQNLSKDFYQAHNQEWPYTQFLKSNLPFVVYQSKSYRKWEKCTYTAIDVAQANTIEQVYEIIKKRKSDYSFTDEQILHTHNPNSKITEKNEIEKNYGEVYAKYSFISSKNAKAVLAEFKNNSKDYAAVITVYRNNDVIKSEIGSFSKPQEAQIIVLQPNNSTKINLKTQDFYVETFMRKKDEQTDNNSWVNWIKDKIKHHVIKDADYQDNIEVKENTMNSTPGSTGVRG